MSTTEWTAAHVAAIALAPLPAAPLIDAADAVPFIDGVVLWDFWPVEDENGGQTGWWMALSAPREEDPDARHSVARIRLLRREGERWQDEGLLFPDHLTPGSREWSGSATLAGDRLTVRFTAAGRRDEQAVSYEQRLFESSAPFHDGMVDRDGWSTPTELVVPDRRRYMSTRDAGGGIGTIKAWRDPAWFRDPRDGSEYLLFTASLAQSASPFNGAIGVARREGAAWVLRDPLVTADGLNNELERPHVRHWNNRYFLFWSTQRSVFAADGPSGPTGLYGMVADALTGPYTPLNGTGLVLCNPEAAPSQAYSWLVLDNGDAVSFVDRVPGFAGTIAPAVNVRPLLAEYLKR